MKRGRSGVTIINLFHNNTFDVAQVAGAFNGVGYMDVHHDAMNIVNDLIRQYNMQCIPQIVLDRYILPCILIMSNHPIIQICHWEVFITSYENTFQVKHLVDIAKYVRGMLMGLTPCDQLGLLLQYSMPYIKHNRLSFPSYDQTSYKMLTDIIRLTLAMCLGLFTNSTTKPVWQQRLNLVAMFHKLLLSGSPHDLYVFCIEHLPLIRLALVEYYVFFVETYLPVEFGLQHILFGAAMDVRSIFRQIRLICNSFRHGQFQTTDVELNWQGIIARCQACVEKCNRTCKAKSKLSCKNVTQHSINYDCMSLALHTNPCCDITILGMHMQGVDPAVVHTVHEIHRTISINYLPFNIVNEQRLAIQSRIRSNTKAVMNGLYLHVCLRCRPAGITDIDRNIRIGPNQTLCCGKCLKTDAMLCIHMLGRTVKIRNTTFYLCSTCLHVHTWKGIGNDFMACVMQSNSACMPKSICILCERNNNVSSLDVLNVRLGVIQRVSLCQRHTPYPFQMKFVCDIESLMIAIFNKYKKQNHA